MFVGGTVLVVGSVYVAVHVGNALNRTNQTVPADPFSTFFGLFDGSVRWPGWAGWTVLGLFVAVLAAGSALVWHRWRPRTRVDRASGLLGHGRDIEPLSRRSAQATADRLGVPRPVARARSWWKFWVDAAPGNPGVPIGTTLGGQHLYGAWEDMQIDVWGPRTGKTTSRAIPAILTAPGAVLVTSNKRDVVDATRDPRRGAGRVWVFDPQDVAGEPPSWWWDPLTYVTDEVKAKRMAEHFAAGSRDPGARTDAFFEPAGEDLLAGMLLAAALDRRPITDVYRWLTRPSDVTPARILRDRGYTLIADQVDGEITSPEKQRAGVFRTAQQMASCLTIRQMTEWVTPSGGGWKDQFDPQQFVREGGTLYSLSKEGKGSAGPLVTALTVAVVEAAEELAARSTGGRLPVPLLGVLDEAANVCRWRQLPDLYSHYGSRGIVLMTILQSWSQGVDVWGESGMKKLWSAANVKVYGGGVSEGAFLDELSKLVGDYDRLMSSTSYGAGRRTVSRQMHKEPILTVSDLAAMPRGRAVVFASGARPTLVRTVPWMEGPHAQAVRASITAHDPKNRPVAPAPPVPAQEPVPTDEVAP